MEQLFQIKESDINSEDAKAMINLLNVSLTKITGNSGVDSFTSNDIGGNHGIFIIGYYRDKPISCGALRLISENTGEIKRVFAMKNDLGAAHKIIKCLEEYAKKRGIKRIQLETRIINQHAVDFYYSCHYKKCTNYGKYTGREDAICFEKIL